jgi:hypothetical protein
MKDASRESGQQSTLKTTLFCILHQFVGTWGVAVLGYYLVDMVFGALGHFDSSVSSRSLYWILTETPYFPVQIGLGLYFGWVMGWRLRQKLMVWTWIIPGLILLYAVLAIPTLTPRLTSLLGQSSNPFSHYFGWGCQPKNRCLDQVLVTMPFYASFAYSIGGWLGIHKKIIHSSVDVSNP